MTTYSKAILKEAVEHSDVLQKQGMLERMFTAWFSGFVYNQIWEDPRVDAEALAINESSKILTIASGGCNILNYLIHSPCSIDAVDLNYHHVNLSRLKLAAAQYLPSYRHFLNFFGVARGEENIQNYFQYIAPHLSGVERLYWEGPLKFRFWGAKRRIEYFKFGLYKFSRSALFLRFLHVLTRLSGCNAKKLLEAKSIDEQRRLFARYLEPSFNNPIVRVLGKLPPMLYSLGIPPQQFDELANDGVNGVVSVFRERTRRLACNFSLKENYFAWQALGCKYNTDQQESLPDYLQEHNFEKIKGNACRDRVHLSSLTQFLKRHSESSLNCFVFLDSQDWMTELQLNELWEEVARVGEYDTRVIFRTAGRASPVESKLDRETKRRFLYDKVRSATFYERDRAAVYGGFHLYQKVA